MIKGIHAMFYTSNPLELRAFIRDKLGLCWADTGNGWLIFEAPEAEIGCHPPVDELKTKGVEFTDEITDAGYGLVIHFRMPGGVVAELYEPLYSVEYQ